MKPINSLKNLFSLTILRATVPFLVLLLVIYFIFIPAIKEYIALTGRIKNKEMALSSVKASNAQYEILKGEINNKESQIEQLKMKLFWERDISKFLNELTNLASDLQIEFVSLKPEASVEPLEKDKGTKDKEQKDFLLTKVPIEVTFRSNYNGIINFLKRIEEGQKFINIDTLSIESQPADIYKHNVKMKLSILIEKGG